MKKLMFFFVFNTAVTLIFGVSSCLGADIAMVLEVTGKVTANFNNEKWEVLAGESLEPEVGLEVPPDGSITLLHLGLNKEISLPQGTTITIRQEGFSSDVGQIGKSIDYLPNDLDLDAKSAKQVAAVKMGKIQASSSGAKSLPPSPATEETKNGQAKDKQGPERPSANGYEGGKKHEVSVEQNSSMEVPPAPNIAFPRSFLKNNSLLENGPLFFKAKGKQVELADNYSSVSNEWVCFSFPSDYENSLKDSSQIQISSDEKAKKWVSIDFSRFPEIKGSTVRKALALESRKAFFQAAALWITLSLEGLVSPEVATKHLKRLEGKVEKD
ncbi:hypothetical protein HYY75_09485 [bacterium]|nr:hypothetical protein [bacterium]